MTEPIRIYIHIPFCDKKCNYCAFYSVAACKAQKEEYIKRLKLEIIKRGGQTDRPASSVYIGGGTPSVMSGEELAEIINTVKTSFCVLPEAEITVELNPADNLKEILPVLKQMGVNRLSIGVQCGSNEMLSCLGRRHRLCDAENAVLYAKKQGFSNISLDLMIGLPKSDIKTLSRDLEFICGLKPQHISAYILKIEENTPFFAMREELKLPDDDEVADQYLFMCKTLETLGYEHYEISNFALDGFASRHNSGYWKCEEYIGFGPSAHSFYNKKRSYYSADICQYIENPQSISDGDGGGEEEYIMLALRLKSGINSDEFEKRFDRPIPQKIFKKAEPLGKAGLLITDGKNIRLTNEGMLVSNSIISELTEEL